MTEQQPQRPVWRRGPTPPPVAATDREGKQYCGGRELSVRERYDLMKERRRVRKEAEAREQGRADARAAARHPSLYRSEPEEGDDEAAGHGQDKRYAAKLLRQDESAWGGGGGASGDIG